MATYRGPAISGNRGKRAWMWWRRLPALGVPRERQVLFQQVLDATQVPAAAGLSRAAELVEDALAREQDLAPGPLARHQPREQLQAAGAQVFGGLAHARFQHLDGPVRIGVFLRHVVGRRAL